MIGIIPTLLTPAMLAMSPPSLPATHCTYDWQGQRTVLMIAGKSIPPLSYGSLNGTQSYISGGYVIDDWNQD